MNKLLILLVTAFVIFLSILFTISNKPTGFSVLSFEDNPPIITNAFLDKIKYFKGDQMMVTVVVEDDFGVKEVKADIEFEDGVDTIDLVHTTGTEKKGTWQGTWIVHDTKGQVLTNNLYNNTLF